MKILSNFLNHFLTNWGKNEDEKLKNWETEFNLLILHIKTRLYENFHENLRVKWN